MTVMSALYFAANFTISAAGLACNPALLTI
jgi:hypothetical protein